VGWPLAMLARVFLIKRRLSISLLPKKVAWQSRIDGAATLLPRSLAPGYLQGTGLEGFLREINLKKPTF
jgi:hypothetical protein